MGIRWYKDGLGGLAASDEFRLDGTDAAAAIEWLLSDLTTRHDLPVGLLELWVLVDEIPPPGIAGVRIWSQDFR